MTNDRATAKQAHHNASDGGIGDDLRSFLAEPVQPEPRTRNLRATFRPVPGAPAADAGFPGTRAFSAHRADARAAGSNKPAARARLDRASAPAARADDSARRGTAVPGNGSASRANGAGLSADQGATGRGVRGRGRKGKQAEAKPALPKAIAKLAPKDPNAQPSSSRIIPTESERADARRLFREIGERFNENRKKSKTAAYAAYRHDLMANLDTLIMGGAIDLKEATTIITNLEQYTKETEAESTETPATILGRWLRMDVAEIAALEATAVVEESVEEGAELEADGEETEPEVDGNKEEEEQA